jgi:hypothetical protein
MGNWLRVVRLDVEAAPKNRMSVWSRRYLGTLELQLLSVTVGGYEVICGKILKIQAPVLAHLSFPRPRRVDERPVDMSDSFGTDFGVL